MTTDVIVVGGGPVGLAAAVEARLAGLSVVVCEPRPAPLDKACGEGLMPGAVSALHRLGVAAEGRPFAGIRYVAGATVADHRFRAGPGLGVRRTELHRALAARAGELGAETIPFAVDRLEQDDAGVVVRPSADGGTACRGRWLLACDGLHSAVRRAAGLAGDEQERAMRRYGVRRHYRVAPWSEFVEVHWTPDAEVYVTPVGNELVGVAALGGRGLDYDAVLTAAPGVAERLAGARPASQLRGAGPLRQRASARVAGRVLLAGDAAGYVDALTGEGIRLGLAQVRAAVEAISAGRPDRYERDWRRITRDYRMLTGGLVAASARPAIRRQIVPLAARLPRVYGAIVDRLAG
jgi:menaquinone-9 beta-reductase